MGSGAVFRWARSGQGRKLIRYGMVSVVAIGVTQLVLLAGLDLGWSSAAANITAVSVASVPAYFLNRQWVWGRDGRHDVAREIVPYWVFAFVGLALSTVAVATVASGPHASHFVAAFANVGAFGLLWGLRFVVLDRLLFAPVAS
jgi:putative flippase GtrA